ncbi:MAG: AAA family ATPase, partial [Thermoguttaceae bacterium]
MNPTAAFFKSIEIRRMPGFQRGDLALPELSPGINVIYGPNASGKTTLSRAIHYLLRPPERSNDHVSLRASAEVNGRQYELDCDSGRLRATDRAQGAAIDYPKLAPAEIGDRHVLALQDLIRTEHDHDLANQIVRELSGGYDVSAARKVLGFSRQPARRGRLTKELSQAEKRHQAALRRQDELIERQAALKRLQAEKAAAEAALAEMGLLEKAAERLAAEERVAEVRNRLRVFPAGVARVSQHEIERLDSIHKALEAARTRRRKEESRREKAQRE